jgi:hypothetical protein
MKQVFHRECLRRPCLEGGVQGCNKTERLLIPDDLCNIQDFSMGNSSGDIEYAVSYALFNSFRMAMPIVSRM